MSDRSAELHATLAHLHEQLEAAGSLDEAARTELREALEEIRAAVEGDGGARGESQRSFSERLQTAARRFEGAHPALTAAVSRVVDALSALGI